MNKRPMFIDRSLPISKAGLSLTGKALPVLLILLMRRKMEKVNDRKGKMSVWRITNNGEIIFSYAEAKKKFGITDGVFRRAIECLRDKGFIEYKAQNFKEPNKFTLLDDWKSYGTDSFKPRKPKDKRCECMGFQKGNKHGKNSEK